MIPEDLLGQPFSIRFIEVIVNAVDEILEQSWKEVLDLEGISGI